MKAVWLSNSSVMIRRKFLQNVKKQKINKSCPPKKQWLWQLQSLKKSIYTKATTWQRLSDISMVITGPDSVMTPF